MSRVLLTRRWPAAVESEISTRFDAVFNTDDIPMSADDLRAAAQEFDAIAPTVSDRLPTDFLDSPNRRVRLLANYGVGYNHINIDAAVRAGVAVTNTPGVLTDCTADLAMGLLISAARRMGEGDREVRADAWTGWRPTHMIGARVSGRTLGIVGFGRIGQAMAKRAHFGFDMTILVYNRSPVNPEILARYGARQVSDLAELAAGSDFVSLHCPGGGANTHLINADVLSAMGPGSFLINTARGDVVDESALTDALETGRIAGAGLDVYAAEPQISDRLRALPNVILAPHLGSATAATREAMGRMALDNMIAFFEGREPPNRVV